MFLLPGNVAQCSGGAGQMLEMLHPRNMEYRPKQIQVNFTPFWCNLKDDLWKSGCCDLDSERKKVVASSNDSLACALIDLGAFGSMGVHLPSEKPILPYFSSLSMVAILVCDSHRQAGSSSEPFPRNKCQTRLAEFLSTIWVNIMLPCLCSDVSGHQPCYRYIMNENLV